MKSSNKREGGWVENKENVQEMECRMFGERKGSILKIE